MTTGEKLAVTLYRDKYADKALPIYAIILFVFATMCNSYSFQIKKKKKKKQKKRNPRYLVPHQIVRPFASFFFIDHRVFHLRYSHRLFRYSTGLATQDFVSKKRRKKKVIILPIPNGLSTCEIGGRARHLQVESSRTRSCDWSGH